tara:strand:+ start:3746 stop:4159 length:414 start_codon:yes stop_codon:yes gene_type:complete
MSAVTEVTITESVTDLTAENTNAVTVNITAEATTISVNNFAIPINFMDADNVVFTPHNTLTANNVSDALKQLADQQFRGTTAPTAGTANLEEGDLFYDTDDNQIKVYRETSSGVFEFVPIIVGDASGDSDTLDAGAF